LRGLPNASHFHTASITETFSFPPSTSVGGALVLNGFVGSVLLDYFWYASLILVNLPQLKYGLDKVYDVFCVVDG